MDSTGSLFSQTLHDITSTKLDELSKRRATFEHYRHRVIALSKKGSDLRGNLVTISDILKACFGVTVDANGVVIGTSDNHALEVDLKNLDRFLAQAEYDPTVTDQTLERWQGTLLRHAEIQSLKYTYAWLYGQLTTEWLSAKTLPKKAPLTDDVEMEDFEKVDNGKKLETRARWEQSVFTPSDVDPDAMWEMLSALFEATPDDSPVLPKALEALRERVAQFERQLVTSGKFSVSTLHWAIRGLLASDLLTNEKRDTLRDFQGNDNVLREIADALNMRLASLEDWSWGKEVVLEQRRQLTGTYSIYMHVDLLQALFLHHIGVKWSVFWKGALRDFRRTKEVWKAPGEKLSTLDKQRRGFYLGTQGQGPSVVSVKKKLHYKKYFLSQLLTSEYQETDTAEGDEEADYEPAAMLKQTARKTKQAAPRAQAPPRMQMASKAARRAAPAAYAGREADEAEEDDDDMGFALFDDMGGADDDDEGDDDNSPRNPMAAKQNLLHLLSTEIIIQKRLKGELSCFKSQIDNLYPSLPHSTIKAMLACFGVSKKWLQFFGRFLEAPLRFKDDSSEVRQRKTGTPGSFVLSEVFAEVVLFCMDFMVNQRTDGEILWRMHDDFWFWSADREKCVKAWSTVQEFARVIGLKMNDARTGSVRVQKSAKGAHLGSGDKLLPQGPIRWGMLCLNSETGRFEIDQDMVDTHIEELNRQLADKGGSVFAWIQVWNSYATTFFTSNFGKPANSFGRQHVDNMLATHRRIQQQVFAGNAAGSFTEHLKKLISDRHGVSDIPDGYFYWPTELGGLEISSPFISLLQVRDAVLADADKVMQEFEAAEKETYRSAKQHFDDDTYRRDLRKHGSKFMPEHPDTFMSFEEYTTFRDELNFGFNNQLVDVFKRLLEQPQQQSIDTDVHGEVMRRLNNLGSGKLCNWYSMEPYWKWVAQLYGPEMIERFGGMKVVDSGLLPMGMLELFRSGRVNWQD